jgi:FMN phosphatase YigB (HAD superfamily)
VDERARPRPLAVVFDLDDTLFDAHGQCVLPAHAEAARAMCAAGLDAPFEAVRALRLELGDAPDLDERVARAFPCADPARVAAAGRRAFLVRDPGSVTPFTFSAEVLAAVRAVARALLLTAGDEATQRTKLARLGLGPLLDDVLVVDPSVADAKRRALAAWIAAAGLAPERVLVVGDRPRSEIAAALALGCPALRIRGGECAAEPTPPGVPEAPDVRATLRWL